MRCISPLLVRNDGRRDFVPCGKCNFCLQTKRADWSFRLLIESRKAYTAKFLTLTYSDENLPISEAGFPQLCKRDIQLFTKRLRKDNSAACEWPLRYYTVGEYGTKTNRPHYHAIMFNIHPSLYKRFDYWQGGHIQHGEVSMASIHYVTKYVINRHGEYSGREPPFALMSRRPGLGATYMDTHKNWHRADMRNYTKVNGHVMRLPRYFKDKMFSDHERKLMATKAIEIGDIEYWNEIERLASLHNDALSYYEERERYAHEDITNKVNSNNTF